MLMELKRVYGKQPVLYIGDKGDYLKILSMSEFKDYQIWVAGYSDSPPSSAPNSWQFWQYTDQGAVNGIHGRVDRNAFFGTAPQWQEFLAAAK